MRPIVIQQPLVILGSTGNQGGHVAHASLAAGWPIRAVTRHPEGPAAMALASAGAQLIQADMGDIASLIRAFKGARGIFSVQNFWELGIQEEVRLGTNVMAATRAVGNPHMIYSSGWGAESLRGVAAIDGKAILEDRLRASGLPYTILRPGLFMDDLRGASLPFPLWMQRLLRPYRRQVGRLFLSVLQATFPPDKPIPLVALADVGRVARWAWEHPVHSQGHVWELAGSYETVSTLSGMWAEITGEKVWKIPGLNSGLRLVHPHMASLLAWLSEDAQPQTALCPIALRSFADWASINTEKRT